MKSWKLLSPNTLSMIVAFGLNKLKTVSRVFDFETSVSTTASHLLCDCIFVPPNMLNALSYVCLEPNLTLLRSPLQSPVMYVERCPLAMNSRSICLWI